jgi:hypothetical protein
LGEEYNHYNHVVFPLTCYLVPLRTKQNTTHSLPNFVPLTNI